MLASSIFCSYFRFFSFTNCTLYLPNYFGPEEADYVPNVLQDYDSFNISELFEVPIDFDWRSKGTVSPVKDQGSCNACWAFAVTASIESHLKIYKNQEEILSEQYLIDCLKKLNGCGPDLLQNAYADIITETGGVLRESDYYPYTARREECRKPRFNSTESTGSVPPGIIPVVGFRKVRQNEDEMAKYLYEYGPLSAAINAASMKHYHGNYIDEPTEEECDPKTLDHTVLIVGYNVHVDSNTGAEVPYWIIKNSWGQNFGDDGFYYLVRGRNACGITSDVSFPIV